MPALWCSWPIALPVLASLLDFIVGDPWSWPHPVQGMGWGIRQYQQVVWRWAPRPGLQRLWGIGLGLGLPIASAAIALSIPYVLTFLHPFLGIGGAVVIMASCFAGRSLRRAATDVLEPLHDGKLEEARQRLSLYVGRDTQDLAEPDMLRAVMETISENATDGVMAPLFYALVGTAIAPLDGVCLAIAYKALSTLDSMVGYRTEPYLHFGWFSARCEDIATWLPCRLTVLTIALLSGRPGHIWHVCCRDAPQDPSPNAGWSECAYAAALGVQVGGRNRYQGIVKEKPLLAEPTQPITPIVIQQGLRLTRLTCLLWLGVGCIVLALRYRLHC